MMSLGMHHPNTSLLASRELPHSDLEYNTDKLMWSVTPSVEFKFKHVSPPRRSQVTSLNNNDVRQLLATR